MQKQAILKITGDVQGVCFRSNAKKTADRLGLRGWAKNMPDGSVEVKISGEEKAVTKMVDWCWKGPSIAKVSNVQTTWKHAPTKSETGSFKIY